MTITFLGLLVFSAVSAVGGLLISKWIWEKKIIDEQEELIEQLTQERSEDEA